jgi:hypothetical protein
MPWLCSQRATLTPSSPWRRPNFPSHPNVSPNASRKRGSYFEKGNCIGHALCSPVQPHADSKTRLRNRYVHAIRTMPPCTGLHTQRLSSPENKAPRNAIGRTRGRWSGTVHRQKSARNRTSEWLGLRRFEACRDLKHHKHAGRPVVHMQPPAQSQPARWCCPEKLDLPLPSGQCPKLSALVERGTPSTPPGQGRHGFHAITRGTGAVVVASRGSRASLCGLRARRQAGRGFVPRRVLRSRW